MNFSTIKHCSMNRSEFVLCFTILVCIRTANSDCNSPQLGSNGIEITCKSSWMRKIWKECKGVQRIGTRLNIKCGTGFSPLEKHGNSSTFLCDYDETWRGEGDTNIKIADFRCIRESSFDFNTGNIYFYDTEIGRDETQLLTQNLCPPLKTDQLGIRITCEHRANPMDVNMRSNCSEPQLVGTKGLINCQEYYSPKVLNSTNLVMTCEKNGTWSRLDEFEKFGCTPECGLGGEIKVPYIIHGNITSPQTWPWHATIFRTHHSLREFHYICGGSLITESLVITAAHCVIDTDFSILPTEDIMVRLGSMSSTFLNNPGDGSFTFHVKAIYIHPTFDETFQGDIALIQLDKDVQFSRAILPVCLPDGISMDKRALEPGNYGKVVGFGNTENGTSSAELRQASIPIANDRECYVELGNKISISQICTGRGKNGENVCRGDSGGGLIIPNEFRTASYLHGIVSWSSRNRGSLESKGCTHHVVFTKVFSFIHWILQKVEDVTGERRILAAQKSDHFFEQGSEEKYKRFNTILYKNERISSLHLKYEDIDPKVLLDGFLERIAGDIETINLDSVEFYSEFMRKVRLPFLKNLRVDRMLPGANLEAIRNFTTSSTSLDDLAYNSIFVRNSESWDISQVTHLGINIELNLVHWKILKVDHENGELVSMLPSTSKILSNVDPKFSLKKLTLANEEKNIESIEYTLIPKNLIYLKILHVLLQGDSRQESQGEVLVKLFKRCPRIQSFIYEMFPSESSGIFIDKEKNEIQLSNLLAQANQLKKLYINVPANINLKKGTKSNLKFLGLHACILNSEGLENFHIIFKNISEIYLADIPLDSRALLLKNALKTNAKRISLYGLLDPLFLFLKLNDDIEIYYKIDNYTKNHPSKTTLYKIYLGFVFERNFSSNGNWVIVEKLSNDDHTLFEANIVDEDKLFTSYLDSAYGRRLTTNEKYLHEYPGVGYRVGGSDEKQSVFDELLDETYSSISNYIHIDFDRTNVSTVAFLSFLRQTWKLQFLFMSKVELIGNFEVEDKVWLPSLELYRLELRGQSYDFYFDQSSTLESLVPFYTLSKYWTSDEILLLGVTMEIIIGDVEIFLLKYEVGRLSISLVNSNDILEKHKHYSNSNLTLCQLYKYDDPYSSCKIQDRGKYYTFVIKSLFLRYCIVNVDFIPGNLTTVSLHNVNIGNGKLDDILAHSPSLKVVAFSMGFTPKFSYRDFIPSLLNKYTMDVNFLNTSTLNELELFSVGLTNRFNISNLIFKNMTFFGIDRCELDSFMQEHIFDIFHASVYNIMLKPEQYAVLERAILPEMENILGEIRIKMKATYKNSYSDALISFLKKLNLDREGIHYYIYLIRQNRTWVGKIIENEIYDYQVEEFPDIIPSE